VTRTIKREVHLQPFEKLARNVIARGWLDSIGHGTLTSWTPHAQVKQEAIDWIGTDDYYYWADIAGLEKRYIDQLYTKFQSLYTDGIPRKENPHASLMQLFDII